MLCVLSYLLNLKGSNGISRQLLKVGQCHMNKTVLFWGRNSARPILVTFNPRSFLQLGHHNDSGGVLFPTHSPEVAEGFWKRTLRRNVGVLLSVSVAVVGVDVIAALNSVDHLQDDSRVVVGDDVRVAILWFVDF